MTSPISMNEFLSRLSGVKRSGNGHMAHCPAHDDRDPSLSITPLGDGAFRFKCFAGCSRTEILNAMDIDPERLRPTASSHGRPKANRKRNRHAKRQFATADDAIQWISRKRGGPIGHWVYENARGEAVGHVLRWDSDTGKEILPLSLVDGKWSFVGMPKPRPLYHLSRIIEPSADRVFVCEGEKACEAAISLDLLATTSPHGSESPHLTDWSPLGQRDIVLLPDNDGSGSIFAKCVVKLLGKVSPLTTVRILNLPGLPPSGDIVEYIEQNSSMSHHQLRAEINRLADSQTPVDFDQPVMDVGGDATLGGDDDSDDDDNHNSQSELLVRLALERFRFGRTPEDEPFAVPHDGPNIAIMFRGSREALRATLAREFRRRHGKTPNGSALSDALTALHGEAMDAAQEPVALRLTKYEDAIVIDLGDEKGRAAIVRPGRWEILNRSPVLFRRSALISPMPLPVRGGDLDELRVLVNVTDEGWSILRGFMVAALIPWIPHPILLLGGLQGTGKSSAARCIVIILDPSPAPLRSQPRDIEQWAVASSSCWVVCIDNVSHIPDWWSDAMCKSVTGDGLIRRRLYTDSELSVLAFRRVVVLTSIDAGALRGDLGERLILLDLEAISKSKRQTDEAMSEILVIYQPRLFGALLDLLARYLADRERVHLNDKPRMADFAGVLAVLDQMGLSGPPALPAYLGQQSRIAAEVIDDDLIGAAIVEFIRTNGQFQGTAGDLLDAIKPKEGADVKKWPKHANGLTGRIKRLIPALREMGILVTIPKERTARGRIVTIERSRDESSPSSQLQ